ncbi:MAG TPA: succinate dehydrogenase assembly factor 2 [Burkholderiaceae bacterium]
MPRDSAAPPIDADRRRRLRWRARRGLLENDLVLQRFFAAHETTLGEDDVAGLDALLDLPDNELLELILGRREPEGIAAQENPRRVLQLLREA